MKKVSHLLEYLVVLFAYSLVSLFPFSSLDAVAKVLFFLLSPLLGSQKKRIRNNLEFALPELKGKDRENFIRRNLAHNLRSFLEISQSRKLKSKRFVEKRIDMEKPDSMDVLFKGDKPIVIIEGHFGNWELPVARVTQRGLKVKFAAKHMRNLLVDKFINSLRKNYGGEVIYLEKSTALLRELKQGGAIGLVADQDAGRTGVFVDFFGRKASTYTGPATLAYIAGAKIVLVTNVYTGKGKYLFKTRVVYDGNAEKEFADIDEATQVLTQKWSSMLEEEVREYPEQYFWVHRRWKTRPAGEAK